MSQLTHAELAFVKKAVEKQRLQIEATQLRDEIQRLKDEVDFWKDRCMAAEQAHDATIEHYEQLTNREW